MAVQTESSLFRAVNIAVSFIIVGAVVYLGIVASEMAGDDRLFLEAAFFFTLAAVFWLSYFKTKWLYLFRGVAWVSGTWSFPQKKYMTAVYSAAFFLYGAWQFYQWLFAR